MLNTFYKLIFLTHIFCYVKIQREARPQEDNVNTYLLIISSYLKLCPKNLANIIDKNKVGYEFAIIKFCIWTVN